MKSVITYLLLKRDNNGNITILSTQDGIQDEFISYANKIAICKEFNSLYDAKQAKKFYTEKYPNTIIIIYRCKKTMYHRIFQLFSMFKFYLKQNSNK